MADTGRDGARFAQDTHCQRLSEPSTNKRAKSSPNGALDMAAQFTKLQELNDKYGGIPAEHVWCMDGKVIEIELPDREASFRYYVPDSKWRYKISSMRNEAATVVECASAAGASISPFIVLPPDPCLDSQKLKADTFSGMGFTESGRMEGVILAEWLPKIFFPFAKLNRITPTKPIVLILLVDESGESSVIQHEMPEKHYFPDGEVVVLCFPSKAMGRLRPLDLVFFTPLGHRWRDHYNTMIGRDLVVDRDNVLPEYLDIRQRHSFPQSLRSAFAETGLYPINSTVFTENASALTATPSSSSQTSAVVHAEEGGHRKYRTRPRSVMFDLGDEDSDSEWNPKKDDMDSHTISAPNKPRRGRKRARSPQAAEADNSRSSSSTLAHPYAGVLRSLVSNIELSDLFSHCRDVPIQEDKAKSRSELIDEVRKLRRKLRVICDTLDLRQVAAEASNSRVAMMRQALVNLTNRAGSTGGSEGVADKTDKGKKAKAAGKAKVSQKSVNKIARSVRGDTAWEESLRIVALTESFHNPLASYKRKYELCAIAGALGISDKGTIPELRARIEEYLEDNSDLEYDPQFAGLYRPPRRPGGQEKVIMPRSWFIDSD